MTTLAPPLTSLSRQPHAVSPPGYTTHLLDASHRLRTPLSRAPHVYGTETGAKRPAPSRQHPGPGSDNNVTGPGPLDASRVPRTPVAPHADARAPTPEHSGHPCEREHTKRPAPA
jgi:hypothetical protein